MQVMIPLIAISSSPESHKKHIDQYSRTNLISPSNIRELVPAKEELSIEEVRQLRKELPYKTNSPVLFVLRDFDRASIEAQNALLKALEEKQDEQHFILTAQTQEKILPTIRSRAKIIRLDLQSEVTIRKEIMTLLSSLPKAKDTSFLADENITGLKKADALLLIDEVIHYYRRELAIQPQTAPEVLKKCLHLKGLISTNNIHVQLAIDNLLLFCWKKVSM